MEYNIWAMPGVLLFDFDGTLIDTIPGIWRLYLEVSEELGLSKKSYGEFSRHLGKTWRNVLHSLWPDVDVEEFTRHYDFTREDPQPIPDVNRALDILSQRHRLAVLTSRGGESLKHHAGKVNLNLDYFEAIYHRNNTDYHKPDCRVFEEVASKLEAEKNDITYIGDSLVDYNCAQEAGVEFIGVLTGPLNREEARKNKMNFLESVADLPGYLELD